MRSFRFHGLAGSVLLSLAVPAAAVDFNQVNLVTDQPSEFTSKITDAGLQNAWGVSFSPTSPFWVSANGANTAVIYRVDPTTQATTKVPLTVSVGSGPTGQVFNGNMAAFNGDPFLFVAEDGSITGWRSALGSTAEVLESPSSDVYKGAAIANIGGMSYLYVAEFHGGSVDVHKGTTVQPDLTGSFTDPGLPSGYAPFNVQNLGGTLYVSYAVQDAQKHDEIAGAGLGIVDRFDLQGNFLGRFAMGGTLNAPWGLAMAPSSFGAWAGAVLVGNFGDGRINVFDSNGSFLGQVSGANGKPIEIDGLWALTPGNDHGAGSSSLLYFSAGPDDEAHGLFGVLTPVPEPSTFVLMLLGFAGVGWMKARKR